MQMDVKIRGLDLAVMKDALAQAREGRLHILGIMNSVISAGRPSVSQHAPRILRRVIPIDKIGALLGPGGKNIRMIQERTGTDVEVDDFGKVVISGKSQESIEEAARYVDAFTKEVNIGDKFEATVVEMKDFGAFVELVPGQEALLHVSEMADHYVQNPRDVVDIGHKIAVTVINVDPSGKIKVSARTTPGRPQERGPGGGGRGDGPRPPRRDDDRGPRHGGGGGGGFGRGGPRGDDRRRDDRPPRPDDRPRHDDRPPQEGPPRHEERPRLDDRPQYDDRRDDRSGRGPQEQGTPGETAPPRDFGDEGRGDDVGRGGPTQEGEGGGGGDAGHFRRRRRR
jgi:polyribonucleotide nucleotidyltransferase